MKINTRNELERIMINAWCHDVRNDYLSNRLWNDESAVQISLAMGLRKRIDSYEELRVWSEIPHTFTRRGKKKTKERDLVIVRLLPEYNQKKRYEYSNEIPYEELLVCEIKFTWYGNSAINTDIDYLDYLMKQDIQTKLFTFCWITYSNIEAEEKINSIIEKTKDIPLRFFVGRGNKPFRWSYYVNGEEKYFL